MKNRHPLSVFATSRAKHLGALLLLFALFLFGGCAEMDQLRAIKEQQNLYIAELQKKIEDVAATYNTATRQSQNQLDAKQLLLEEMERKLNRAETERTEREVLLENVKKNLEKDLATANADLQDQKESVRIKTAQIEKMTEKNGELENSASVLDSKITSLKALVSQAASQEETLNAEIVRLKSDLEIANTKIKTNAGLAEKLETERKNNSNLRADLTRLQEDLSKADDSDELRKQALALEEKLKKMEKGEVILDADFNDANRNLTVSLKPLVSQNFAAVNADSRGVVIALSAGYLFKQGTVTLDPQIIVTLDEIANVLAKYPDKFIEVQGHTDAEPPIKMSFSDNWALGWARADEVARHIARHKDISPKRVKSATCAQFRPPTTEPAKSSQMLRRVEIILTNRP